MPPSMPVPALYGAAIPICISAVSNRKNYQLTPCEEGSESCQRVPEKLNGTYSGPNVIPSYW